MTLSRYPRCRHAGFSRNGAVRGAAVYGDAACAAGSNNAGAVLAFWLDSRAEGPPRTHPGRAFGWRQDFLEDDFVLQKAGRISAASGAAPAASPVAVTRRARRGTALPASAMIPRPRRQHKFSFSSDGANFPAIPNWGRANFQNRRRRGDAGRRCQKCT